MGPIDWQGAGLQAPRNVAVVHDWLVEMAGAEKVLEQILALFPDATLYTLLDRMSPEHRARLSCRRIVTSGLDRLPGVQHYFTRLLPWMPFAIQQFDLSGHDLVISSSHCVAKGVITPPDALHLCYCHSPMRYAWDMQESTLRAEGLARGPSSWLARHWMHGLRQWDAATCHGPEAIATNSQFVRRRVRKSWGRDAEVIPPPVRIAPATAARARKPRQLLSVGRLIGYKNTELLVDAMKLLPEYELLVVGEGPQAQRLRRRAGPNVRFLGCVGDERLQDLLAESAAFLFAAVEDFGIAPVEALGAGMPVVAFGRGGALDYLRPGQNAWLYAEATPDCLAAAVRQASAQTDEGLAARCRESALYYATERFAERFAAWGLRHWRKWCAQASAEGSDPAA